MLKYRVLNLETNQVIQETEVFLTPEGELWMKGKRFTGKFEVQPKIELQKQPNMYVGDAVSYIFNEQQGAVDYFLHQYMKHIPRPEQYDELLIEFAQNKYNQLHYWVMFKHKGEFVTHKDCKMPIIEESEKEIIRKVYVTDVGLLKRLAGRGTFAVVYHCTNQK